jgi:hypothetical protein
VIFAYAATFLADWLSGTVWAEVTVAVDRDYAVLAHANAALLA